MGKLTLLSFLRDQFTTLPTVDSFKCDLTGKTVIVVGSNTGLGLEAARHLATMNPGRLILACRSVSKGEMALESIRVTTKYKGGEVWVVDLTDFASISAFADKFEKDGGGRLDVLLENSAIVTETYYRTKDGLESTIQTNNLGTALLGILLLPFLSRSSADSVTPRIVIVASEVHYWAKLDTEVTSSPQMLEKLNSEEYCTASVMKQRYFISKLINVLFMRAFAARLSPQNPVIIDAVNPGFCRSELLRSVQPTFLMSMMERLLARSTECGSRTLVHAAIGGGKELRGRYLSSCAVREESDYCLSKEGGVIQDRLWNETMEMLSAVDPRVNTITTEYLQPTAPSRTF
ncbi:NAD(P)-binding protein [Rickenella mellea]|uniref:NAD(P)-binding protein n=1 Tax=Rickenella mellea TaxID=50990 RepID=A0A4R5XG48_9AGAM|nr:NAD(P)-binding protein [Rickenella mellea]